MTQLGSKKLELANNGIRFNVFRATPEIDTPVSAMLDRGYWAHVSANLRPGDKIEVIPEDFSYFAELIVIDAGKLYANVRLLRNEPLSEPIKVKAGYDIKWAGPYAKFRVVRGKDVLQEGFADKSDANAWLENHVKAA